MRIHLKGLISTQLRCDAAENSDESKVKVMIKEIRCNQETKQEGEKAKKTLENLSSRRMAWTFGVNRSESL